MAIIYTSKGHPIIVDDADYDWLSQYKWTVGRSGYAVATSGPYVRKSMHRVIMGLGTPFDIDHINNLRHDNRRSNLRAVTHRENMQNQLGPRQIKRDEVTGKLWLLRGHNLIGIYDTRNEAREAFREAVHGKTPAITNTSIPID